MKLNGILKKGHFENIDGNEIFIIDEFKLKSITITEDEEKNILGLNNTKPKTLRVLLILYDEVEL